MKAGQLLALCAVIQLVVVIMNFSSEIFFYVLPLTIVGIIFLAVSVYFKWKRGVEVFIGLSVAVLVIVLIPFMKILIDRTVKTREYEFACYCLEIVAEFFTIGVAIWVLYHTDYVAAEEEKPLNRSFSNPFSGSFGNSSSPNVKSP